MTGIASALFAVAATSSARAEAWRCVDEPGEQNCQDALINDIEALTKSSWPSFVTLAQASIPYTCTKSTKGNPPIDPFAPVSTNTTVTINGSVHWSATWTGIMQDFVIGGHSANTFLSLSVGPVSSEIDGAFWAGNQIAFSFAESSNEVQSSAGSTGVGDLGAVMAESLSGPAWTATMRIRVDPGDGQWNCTMGGVVSASGKNTVWFDYPVAYTGLKSRLQEAIRNDFRQAVRTAVGLP